MGFIRGEPHPVSPDGNRHFKVYPVTARHNIRNFVNPKDGQAYDAIQAQLVWLTEDYSATLTFAVMNWKPKDSDKFSIRDGEESVVTRGSPTWPYGVDAVSAIQRGITGEASSFELVRSSFRLEVGQKVGIAVLFTENSRPNAKTVAGWDELQKRIDENELKRIYGEPGFTYVSTGEITYVGEKHIEYDINSLTLCSGAIVFLLDGKQPDSVQPCDHGKAIAVHGGAHPFINARNLGFLLRGNLPHVGSN